MTSQFSWMYHLTLALVSSLFVNGVLSSVPKLEEPGFFVTQWWFSRFKSLQDYPATAVSLQRELWCDSCLWDMARQLCNGLWAAFRPFCLSKGLKKDDGGQVLVAIKTGLQNFHYLDLEKENIVLIVVEIKTSNCISVILFTFCHSSGSSSEILDELNSFLQGNAASGRIDLAGDVFTLYWLVHRSIYRCHWLFTGSQEVDNVFC